MSFRRPRDRAFEPSSLHQPTYSQGPVGVPTTLRQPTQSDWTPASTSLPQLVAGAGATQETPPSSPSMIVRNERDFSLALSIQAALADTRECPWYGVWAKVLQNYIFFGANKPQTACTCVPQYSLVASYDSGRLPRSDDSDWSESDISMGSPSPDRHLTTPGSPLPRPPVAHNTTLDFSPQSQAIFGGPLPPLTPSPLHRGFHRRVPSPDSPTMEHVTRMQTRRSGNVSNIPVSTRPLPQSSSSSYPYPSDGILPITPSRPATTLSKSNASFRIPDFVQILEHAQQPFPVVTGHVIRRVIMIVEIKPEPHAGRKFEWESIWKDQVREQVLHAFEADGTLKYLGVIIAAGRHWVYGIVNRGNLLHRTMSETRDPTFRGTRSPASSSNDSTVEEREVQRSVPSLDIPNFLPKTENGAFYKFDLLDILDARGVSLRAFEGILNDLRRKNSDIWF